ncbi:uncharacterized protein F4807DRAFT_59098 [Annulohypoxylon truncatum]|uniref:uncharacterized protein n=1 Tax=Annulohypoxylon truncatum TaxID=327061 RepID=UPI0020082BC6|nr:uncharacterized protein F4807DRAFT_59098 [Annulohypoxylon truncatum]KAI1210803.1 hypothetical protein F4807DRAFT_59098 [Annulohypoxylon truncatum]
MDPHSRIDKRELPYLQLKCLREEEGEKARQCDICDAQYRLHCTHLSFAQCAELKPARYKVEADGDCDSICVYECGHAYNNRRRVRGRFHGKRKYRKGTCIECYRALIFDGRVGRTGKPRSAKISRKGSGEDINKPIRKQSKATQKKVLKRWIRRGPMRGNIEQSGEKIELF